MEGVDIRGLLQKTFFKLGVICAARDIICIQKVDSCKYEMHLVSGSIIHIHDSKNLIDTTFLMAFWLYKEQSTPDNVVVNVPVLCDKI